jgi:hypothetical protein
MEHRSHDQLHYSKYSGIYTVTVTDANGCSSSCSQTVVVNPLPICTITGNLSICDGQSTVLCTTAGLASYLWSTGATINCITVNTAGIYTVTVTDANGCSSSCSQTVVVNPPPICTITGNLSICVGSIYCAMHDSRIGQLFMEYRSHDQLHYGKYSRDLYGDSNGCEWMQQ